MSTSLEDVLPSKSDYQIILALNTCLRVLLFLQMVEDLASHLKGWSPRVVEHHQQSKKDISGTAQKLAEILQVPVKDIVSVRDFNKSQETYQSIPKDNQTGYAAGRQKSFTPNNPR